MLEKTKIMHLSEVSEFLILLISSFVNQSSIKVGTYLMWYKYSTACFSLPSLISLPHRETLKRGRGRKKTFIKFFPEDQRQNWMASKNKT